MKLVRLIRVNFLGQEGFRWFNPLDYLRVTIGTVLGLSMLIREFAFGREYAFRLWELPLLAVSTAVTVFNADHLPHQSVLQEVLFAAIVWLALELYAIPLAVWLIREIGKGLEPCLDALSDLNREHVAPAIKKLVDGLRRAPGADWLWRDVEDSWVLKVLRASILFAALAVWASSAFFVHSWLATQASKQWLTSGVVGYSAWLVSVIVGALCAGLIVTLIDAAVDEENEACLFVAGGLTSYALGNWVVLPLIASAWSWWHLIVYLSMALLAMTYVLPGLCKLGNAKFLQTVYEHWKSLMDRSYGESAEAEREGLRHLIAQTTNLALVAWLMQAFILGFVGFRIEVTVFVGVVFALATWAITGLMIDDEDEPTNIGSGIILSVIGAIYAGLFWYSNALYNGIIGSAFAGLLTGSALGLLLIPLAFEALAMITARGGLLDRGGFGLHKIHRVVGGRVEKFGDWCWKGYETPFLRSSNDEKSAALEQIANADSLLKHLVSLCLTIGIAFAICLYASSPFSNQTISSWLYWLGAPLACFITYSMVGYAIVTYETSTLGACLSMIGAVLLASLLSTHQPLGWLFLVVCGLVAFGVLHGCLTPGLWCCARTALVSTASANLLEPIFRHPQSFAWNRFGYPVCNTARIFVLRVRHFLDEIWQILE